jgi:predicted AAA+ superfamily ATPase
VRTRKRYLEPVITSVLSRKMVFVGGPRQVGRTTIALSFLGAGADESHPAYFSFYQVHLGDRHFETGTMTVLPFRTFCRELSLP